MIPRTPRSPLFPYTTLFRSTADDLTAAGAKLGRFAEPIPVTTGLDDINLREPTYLSSTIFYKYWQDNPQALREDRKSTRLNSSHANISYAVLCLKTNHRYI